MALQQGKRMKLKQRLYRCPSCLTDVTTATNHTYEICSGCKNCNGIVLYCMEPEAIKAREDITDTAKVIFHKYRFDITKPTELKQYEDLCEEIKTLGYKKFDSTRINQFKREYFHYIDDKREVKLYEPSKFKTQYIADVGRLHNWYEIIFPNKAIKFGYYLTTLDGEKLDFS
jgi:hypothetical protein